MLAKYGDADEAARKLIEPEFYIKNFLQSHYDQENFPVKDEQVIMTNKLMNKLHVTQEMMKKVVSEGNFSQSNLNKETNRTSPAKIISDDEEEREKDRWITLVEDGSDIANCKKCKVNIKDYLDKYNFKSKGKEIKDR